MKILLIDDEADVRECASLLIRALGHEAITVEGPVEGLAIVDDSFDLQFVDFNMPTMNGLEYYEKFKLKNLKVKTIFLTGVLEAPQECKVIYKPFGLEQLRKAISDSADNRR